MSFAHRSLAAVGRVVVMMFLAGCAPIWGNFPSPISRAVDPEALGPFTPGFVTRSLTYAAPDSRAASTAPLSRLVVRSENNDH